MDNQSYNQEKYAIPMGVYPQVPTQGMPQQGLYQQGAPSQIVSQQPMTTFMTSTEEPMWTWCHLVTSVFSIFCCQIFGFIAIVMSLLSYTDHRVKDFQSFRSKKSFALGFAIAGIVIGCLAIVICIIVFAVRASRTADSIYASNNYWGN